jgi:hypothetical protein
LGQGDRSTDIVEEVLSNAKTPYILQHGLAQAWTHPTHSRQAHRSIGSRDRSFGDGGVVKALRTGLSLGEMFFTLGDHGSSRRSHPSH